MNICRYTGDSMYNMEYTCNMGYGLDVVGQRQDHILANLDTATSSRNDNFPIRPHPIF